MLAAGMVVSSTASLFALSDRRLYSSASKYTRVVHSLSAYQPENS